MKIPDELLKKWQDLRSHGDGKKIAEANEITDMDVSRAFKTGECSDSVFEVLAKFYKEKEDVVKSYLTDNAA